MSEPYEVQLSAGATHAIQEKLPEAVAGAVIEFITGSLRTHPATAVSP